MNSKTLKIIRKISERVPKELLDTLLMEVPSAPATIEVVNKAIEDPDVDEKLKEKLRLIRDSKLLEQTEWQINPEVEKQLDAWFGEQIDLEIKAGRLPKPKEGEELEKLKKKSKQYARRNSNRVEKGSDERNHETADPDGLLQPESGRENEGGSSEGEVEIEAA